MQRPYTYDQIKALYLDHCYPFDEHAIKVFGIRNPVLKADAWDDTLGILTPDGRCLVYSGTTDPGKSPLLKTSGVHPEGIFILMPGYYANCWHKGMHKGRYRALVQFGDGIFLGWRDSDKDGKLDLAGKIYSNVKGLNYHTTRWDKQVMRVGDFSEGCQVQEVANEYDIIMDIIYDSPQAIYSYALF